ncbi:MAG TPA: hypothetical protein VFQ34_00585 [Nitrospiraceae bacterium]|jgi:hypothetical protein|nr:hypothetical protein [Nitrospiraceae bacterium]
MRVIPMCGLCRRVCDDGSVAKGSAGWVDFHHYVARYVIPPSEVMFSGSYCHECLNSYDILKTYGT